MSIDRYFDGYSDGEAHGIEQMLNDLEHVESLDDLDRVIQRFRGYLAND